MISKVRSSAVWFDLDLPYSGRACVGTFSAAHPSRRVQKRAPQDEVVVLDPHGEEARQRRLEP